MFKVCFALQFGLMELAGIGVGAGTWVSIGRGIGIFAAISSGSGLGILYWHRLGIVVTVH